MRYGTRRRRDKGHTKVNTTVLAKPLYGTGSTSERISRGISRCRGRQRKVYQNTTAVPTAGDFSATAVYTDPPERLRAGTPSRLRGCLPAATPRKPSCGAARSTGVLLSSTIHHIPNLRLLGSNRNTLTDADHVATIHGSAIGAIDATRCSCCIWTTT